MLALCSLCKYSVLPPRQCIARDTIYARYFAAGARYVALPLRALAPDVSFEVRGRLMDR